jgi:hypothetical protein
MSTRNQELEDIHTKLQDFLEIQNKEFIDRGQPRMYRVPLDHLAKINVRLTLLIKKLTFRNES